MEKMIPTYITLTKEIGGIPTSYEATVTINDSFVVQVSGDDEIATFYGIAHPADKYHSDKNKQRIAFNSLESDVVEAALEEWGFENNLGWLEDHADVIFS